MNAKNKIYTCVLTKKLFNISIVKLKKNKKYIYHLHNEFQDYVVSTPNKRNTYS
jgi:hypothetical protein